MKKRALAIVLVASMLMTACSTAKETTKGSDLTTVVSSNSETEAETTENTAEAEKTTEQKEDTIIPLFEAPYIDDVKKVSPEKWSTDYKNTYALYYTLISTGRTTGDKDHPTTIYQLSDSNYQPRATFILSEPGSEPVEVSVYICVNEKNGSSVVSFEANGKTDAIDFVPLFYNQTKQCLVGYSGYATNNPGFREVYWSKTLNITVPTDVDPSVYGF